MRTILTSYCLHPTRVSTLHSILCLIYQNSYLLYPTLTSNHSCRNLGCNLTIHRPNPSLASGRPLASGHPLASAAYPTRDGRHCYPTSGVYNHSSHILCLICQTSYPSDPSLASNHHRHPIQVPIYHLSNKCRILWAHMFHPGRAGQGTVHSASKKKPEQHWYR